MHSTISQGRFFLVHQAPLPISPLCCLILRRGFTVNLQNHAVKKLIFFPLFWSDIITSINKMILNPIIAVNQELYFHLTIQLHTLCTCGLWIWDWEKPADNMQRISPLSLFPLHQFRYSPEMKLGFVGSPLSPSFSSSLTFCVYNFYCFLIEWTNLNSIAEIWPLWFVDFSFSLLVTYYYFYWFVLFEWAFWWN